MLLQLKNLEESCVLFCLDVRESGASVGWRIRERIKGLVHKEIERKERVKERFRKNGEKKGRKDRQEEAAGVVQEGTLSVRLFAK